MKKTIRLLAILSLLAMVFSGCASMILPYEEEPLCRKGVEGGYCGSLSEVYDAVNDQQYPKKQPLNKTKGEYLK